MINFLLEQAPAKANTWWIYVVLIVLVIVMLVVPTISNRRRMKEYNQMVDRLRVGDEVRTIGGIVGRVTKITKNQNGATFILETGAKGSKTTMEFDINAVGTVLTSTYVEEKPAEKPAKEEVKAEKTEAETKAEPNAEETKAEEVKTEEVKEVKAETKAEEKPKAEKKPSAKKQSNKTNKK